MRHRTLWRGSPIPTKALMSWEGRPYCRWKKQYRNKTYRVTYAELGAPVWTGEATRKLANQWWLKKRAEIDSEVTTPEQALVDQVGNYPIEHLLKLIEAGNAARAVMQAVNGAHDGKSVPRDVVERIAGIGKLNDADKLIERASRVVAKLDPDQSVNVAPAHRTIKTQLDQFLATVRAGGIKHKTYDEVSRACVFIGKELGETADASEIDAETIRQFYQTLANMQWCGNTKLKMWNTFKRFVRYLHSMEVISLPRNIDALKSFRRDTPALPDWNYADIREFTRTLSGRLRCWWLLCLNCGMTPIDLAELRKDMVDLETTPPTLKRRRVKTGHLRSVPTVTYALWPETVAALRQHWNHAIEGEYAELALVSEDGTKLAKINEGKLTHLIVQAWKRAKPKLRYRIKDARAIAASAIESHPTYGRLRSLYLGHSPKEIGERRYASAPVGLLADALAWLRGQVVPCDTPAG
jgi:integrase